MGEIMSNPVKILVSFDIKDNRPHNAVRLYTVNGIALGFGEMIVNEVKESNDLFTHLPGFVNYSATIDADKLFKSDKKELVKETKLTDNDVSSTDDPEEDEYVARCMRQLKEAKATITLTTEIDLRQDYRKMKHAKAKSGEKEEIIPTPPEVTKQLIDKRGDEIIRQIEDDTPAVVEPKELRANTYTLIDKFSPVKVFIGDNGKYYLVEESTVSYSEQELKTKQGIQQLALDNLAKFHERGVADGVKPEVTIGDDLLEAKPFSLDDFLKGK